MYRHLLVNEGARIYQTHQQLHIDGKDEHVFPIEDLDTVVLSNRNINMSAYSLEKLCENGTTVIICDGHHMPSAVLMPFGVHSRRLRQIKAQTSQPRPRIKRLWQQIVRQKIANQGKCLSYAGHEDDVSCLVPRVKSGDTGNTEGVAAARYFKNLFGKDFVRSYENGVNAALNYGYAIMRSCVARYLAIYGFEPCLGLFHHSELNAFNLADDLLEPFRPVVDLYVASNIEVTDELITQNKVALQQLLSVDMRLSGQKKCVSLAMEDMVQSLMRCFEGRDSELQLPELLPLNVHRYE